MLVQLSRTNHIIRTPSRSDPIRWSSEHITEGKGACLARSGARCPGTASPTSGRDLLRQLLGDVPAQFVGLALGLPDDRGAAADDGEDVLAIVAG